MFVRERASYNLEITNPLLLTIKKKEKCGHFRLLAWANCVKDNLGFWVALNS